MNPVTGLSLGRIAIGAFSLARPQQAATLFGLDPVANPQAPYVIRLFASREIALGTATLVSRGRGRAGLLLLGVGVDGADAATGYLGPQEGQVPQRAGQLLAGPALFAVLTGLLGLRAEGRRAREARAEAKAGALAASGGRKARKAARTAAKRAAQQKAAGKAAAKASKALAKAR
ncbi:DUF4267 domain-containing protein [Nocardioides sp. TRM66260-LWL]|uniref:DUF4267 domain-containing protein n=1 Tax=Nocardioides sp. TRM66260-LWL TaxID=2874478 RepID=UPI001CC5D301|nr:DUF4267 domain-containing protein [Nocardioides sp. TRM66260-LWL]MBZ5733931.1 DUF4267 domain-containing protein [Nocardioides sp. TRM66260-LWL]